MDTIELNLIEEEIKKIKKDFNNGQVHTDGCFVVTLFQILETTYMY